MSLWLKITFPFVTITWKIKIKCMNLAIPSYRKTFNFIIKAPTVSLFYFWWGSAICEWMTIKTSWSCFFFLGTVFNLFSFWHSPIWVNETKKLMLLLFRCYILNGLMNLRWNHRRNCYSCLSSLDLHGWFSWCLYPHCFSFILIRVYC